MPIDDALLSAYLDGELDPDERLAVEGALSSDPALARRLESLTRLRDLLASVPRPAMATDRDRFGTVAERVLALRAQRLERRARLRLVGSWSLVAGLAAAAVLLMLAPFGPGQVRPQGGQALQGQARNQPPVRPSDPGEDGDADLRLVGSLEGDTASTGPAPAEPADPLDEPQRHRETIRRWLERPDARRFLVVADELTPDLTRTVDGLIRDLARQQPDFGRITLDRGLEVDPERPQPALVFVLSLTDDELAQFERRLVASIEDRGARVEQPELTADQRTMLAEVGQIEVGRGPQAVIVSAPQVADSDLAVKVAPTGPPSPTAPPGEPSPERHNSAPAHYHGLTPAPIPARIVLVWLTTDAPAAP